jgi:hypothetical protein
MGEVGKALFNVLKPVYGEIYTKDQEEKPLPQGVDILHICIPGTLPNFLELARSYVTAIKPRLVNNCATVQPGTTAALGRNAVHSTTRGLHPNLERGLLTIPKHVGGPKAGVVASYFEKAGIQCITHKSAEETEVAHILNNASYGINLMFADEMAKLCRAYGVDYYEVVMKYTATNNAGFRELGHESKCRMILTPPGGKIGGHCVTQSAGLIPEELRTPMLDLLAKYNA